jgi:hypothetical protein
MHIQSQLCYHLHWPRVLSKSIGSPPKRETLSTPDTTCFKTDYIAREKTTRLTPRKPPPPYKMATENNIGASALRSLVRGPHLRLAIQANAETANISAMGMNSTVDIATVMVGSKWQAIVVEDSKAIYVTGGSFDTIETALKALLEDLSTKLFCKLDNQLWRRNLVPSRDLSVLLDVCTISFDHLHWPSVHFSFIVSFSARKTLPAPNTT